MDGGDQKLLGELDRITIKELQLALPLFGRTVWATG